MAAKETKATYSPGLAGVIAGETEICWVDPNAGLAYRGYDIHKMAEEASFEEVAHLRREIDCETGRAIAGRAHREIVALDAQSRSEQERL